MTSRNGSTIRKHSKNNRRGPGSFFIFCLISVCLVLSAVYLISFCFKVQPGELPDKLSAGTQDELALLLKHNRETYDFVTQYPDRESYLSQEINLAADRDVAKALLAGEVPLLMQWDLRWGYAPYGDDMVGLAGCGPTCLSMAYIYLTGDLAMHPAAMAEFAWQHGFYSEYGTDWALWTDGAGLLGLSGEVLPLSESDMKNTLDNGGVIICSMRPGDFTTTGHFILIRGYDENGFYVNDPNRKSNSDKQWSYDQLSRQIKNLWGIF